MADPEFPSVDPTTLALRKQHQHPDTVYCADADQLVKITQTAFAALGSPDARTIYLVVPG